jgi:hypothetical protein
MESTREEHTKEIIENIRDNMIGTKDFTWVLIPLFSDIAMNLASIADSLEKNNELF